MLGGEEAGGLGFDVEDADDLFLTMSGTASSERTFGFASM